MNIISRSLEFYDANREKYNKFLLRIKYYTIKYSFSDNERTIITFYDRDRNVIVDSRAEALGTFYNKNNLWVWAWGVPTHPKNYTYLSRKILQYGLDIAVPINNKNNEDVQDLFLKTELITTRFIINNHIQVDIHVAISSYLTKIPLVIPLYNIPIKKGSSSDKSKVHMYKFTYNEYNNFADTLDVAYFFILDYNKIDELIK